MTGLLLLGYSKHKLSTIYMYSMKKKKSYFTHTPPWPNSGPLHNGHFLQSPKVAVEETERGSTVLTLPKEMLIRQWVANRQFQLGFEIQRINN